MSESSSISLLNPMLVLGLDLEGAGIRSFSNALDRVDKVEPPELKRFSAKGTVQSALVT